MLTTNLPTNEPPISDFDPKDPLRQPMPSWRRIRKPCLLILLLGGLGGLLILHLLTVYFQSMPLVSTTCAELLHSADYTKAVKLEPQSQEMTAVQIADKLDGGNLAALVRVTTPNQRNALDVYIFGCRTQQPKPQLIQLFSQQGLIQGNAEITPKHTLVTSALDTSLNPEKVALLQPYQQNVYHEYFWQQDHFVQIPFPSFYPVTSKFEAEALQQRADKGQSVPWHDPITTAVQMSKDLLHWTDDLQPRLISQTQTDAIVDLTETNPHIALKVTLKRLIQPGNTGLWFVTDARTGGMILTQSGTINQPFQTSVTSPIHFSGISALIDGQTTATLFDHTLTPIGSASNVHLSVQPDSSYSGMLTYSNLASSQQGVLLTESQPLPKNSGKESGQVLLTSVLLN